MIVYGLREEAWVEQRLTHLLVEALRRGFTVKTLKVSRREYVELCRGRLVPRHSVVTFCDVPLQVVSD